MRENRPYGLEGGETGLNGLPYPYAGLKYGILSGLIRSSCYPSRRKNRSIAWRLFSTIES